jgi:hypothetical protein
MISADTALITARKSSCPAMARRIDHISTVSIVRGVLRIWRAFRQYDYAINPATKQRGIQERIAGTRKNDSRLTVWQLFHS